MSASTTGGSTADGSASSVATAFISHSDCGRHDTGWEHPEHVGRLRAIPRALRNEPELYHSVLHHGGAAVPILLATDPAPEVITAASASGWTSAVLTDDISASWELALPERMLSGGGRVPR